MWPMDPLSLQAKQCGFLKRTVPPNALSASLSAVYDSQAFVRGWPPGHLPVAGKHVRKDDLAVPGDVATIAHPKLFSTNAMVSPEVELDNRPMACSCSESSVHLKVTVQGSRLDASSPQHRAQYTLRYGIWGFLPKTGTRAKKSLWSTRSHCRRVASPYLGLLRGQVAVT